MSEIVGVFMLQGKSKLYQHPKAQTLYLSIPSKIVSDSQFSFKAGDRVKLKFDPDAQKLEVTKER